MSNCQNVNIIPTDTCLFSQEFQTRFDEEDAGITFTSVPNMFGSRGVAMVKALCYKPVGRGFDSPCHWNSSVT